MERNWFKCIEWLINCKLIPNDHKLTLTTNPKDLALFLRDGVYLCKLLNKLQPDILDPKEFSLHPQMSQLLCTLNINAFLQKCKSDFGLQDYELFEPKDLFQLINFDKVLHTLSSLSRTEKVLKQKIRPLELNRSSNYNFKDCEDAISNATANDHQQTDNNDNNNNKGFDHDDDDDDYCCQGSGADERSFPNSCNDDSNDGTDSDCTYQNTHDQLIYDDLCSVQSSSGAKVKNKVNGPSKSKRDMCIQELVETENKYVGALKMIKLFFMRPLQNYLQPNDYRIIFLGIEKLWSIHTEFEASLKRALSDSTTSTIPDCFIQNKEKFLYYGEFCSNLTSGQELLDKLILNDESVKKKVRECEISANEGKFKLRDLLALPMQRILKYHLFLKEMIKYSEDTKEAIGERVMMDHALAEIHDLSLFINEVKRDNDTISSMHLVQKSILDLPTNLTLKSCGRFIMDDEIRIKILPENNVHTRHLFLYDLLILICKSKGNETNLFNFKGIVYLADFTLDASLLKERGMYGLQLVGKANKMRYIMLSKKEKVRKNWFDSISQALDNLNPEHAITELHNFVMDSFAKPTICDVCRKLLRGVFYQGYKCTRTKMVVHKECLAGAKDMTGPPTSILPPRSTKVVISPISPKQSPGFSMEKAKVIESYTGDPPPEDGNPLHLNFNEVVRILSDFDIRTQWLLGQIENRTGFFPRRCVRLYFSQSSSEKQSSLQRSSSNVLPSSFATNTRSIPFNNSNTLTRHSHNIEQNSSPSEPSNTELLQKLWFVGEMSRDDATSNLITTPLGTFLIRLSVDSSRKGGYALSIKTSDSSVKHIRIEKNDYGKFFISSSKTFPSLLDLVTFYQENSLEPLFPEVKSPLLQPYYSFVARSGVKSYCNVLFDYTATEPNYLSLVKGERLEITSRAGDALGWWKGRSANKVGYFPAAYVEEI